MPSDDPNINYSSADQPGVVDDDKDSATINNTTKVNEGTIGSNVITLPPSGESDASTSVAGKDNETKNGQGGVDDDVKKANDDRQRRIDMGIKFWTHPSLYSVSSSEKRAYLHERGLTDAEIHMVWDHIAMEQQDDRSRDKGGTIKSAALLPLADDRIARVDRVNDFQAVSQNPNSATNQHDRGQKGLLNFPSSNNSHNRGPNNGGNYNSSLPSHYHQSQQYPQSYQYPSGPTSHSLQQYPYAAPVQTTSMMAGGEEEDGGALVVARGMSLVAVGGVLGLAAAAAMRWLDGGEFRMFPPPSPPVSQPTLLHPDQQQNRQQHGEAHMEASNVGDGVDEFIEEYRSDAKFADDDGDYDGCEDEEDDGDLDDNEAAVAAVALQERLLESIESLSKTIETQSATQEKLLKRLVNTASITDSSMSLLRNTNVESQTAAKKQRDDVELDVTSLLAKLSATKDELKSLTECEPQTFGNGNDWQDISTRLLSKLDSCIEMVEKVAISGPALPQSAIDDVLPPSHGAVTSSQVDSFPGPALDSPSFRSCDFSDSTDRILSTPSRISSSLVKSMRLIAESNDPVTLKVGSQLLYLYLVNLSGNPDNPRYRKIYTSSESFRKVESLVGGKDLLLALGFEEVDASSNNNNSSSTLEWIPSRASELELAALSKVKEAAGALSILKSGHPSDELTQLALSRLSLEAIANCPTVDVPISLPPQPDGDDGDTNENHFTAGAPQTPAGTSVVSPPMMRKKLPFPTSSGTPTNLSEMMDRFQG